ncbi:hypothetical protein AJ80_01804 [Polytolypa hystricis UAMH7299]|uniref:Uncharacterized protein n=1 Tax=Polytolypa hystricis (strain UAMH7299) TaxID=1447883 RepID=A0A2B7YZB4_POLH7|nr:hypothetical protein AJ80_01804 [Polytolypa hystricis UAMH7299]
MLRKHTRPVWMTTLKKALSLKFFNRVKQSEEELIAQIRRELTRVAPHSQFSKLSLVSSHPASKADSKGLAQGLVNRDDHSSPPEQKESINHDIKAQVQNPSHLSVNKDHDIGNRLSQVTPYLRPGPSTLQLCLISEVQPAKHVPLRRKPGSRNLRAASSRLSSIAMHCPAALSSTTTLRTEISSAPRRPQEDALVASVDHFTAFCILGAKSEGEPVICASEDIWQEGPLGSEERLFLNIRNCSRRTEIISDVDDEANEVSYLVLFSDLLPTLAGQTQQLLVSFLDVTKFLDDLTADDLHIETFLRETYEDTDTASDSTDTNSQPNHSNPPSVLQQSQEIMASILDNVTQRLLVLYSDYFILSKSSIDPRFYEMSHVSTTICVKGEYANGHLRRTPPETMQELCNNLGGGDRFSVEVKWGDAGAEKRMYCIPLCGPGPDSWICLLIDASVPLLWTP